MLRSINEGGSGLRSASVTATKESIKGTAIEGLLESSGIRVGANERDTGLSGKPGKRGKGEVLSDGLPERGDVRGEPSVRSGEDNSGRNKPSPQAKGLGGRPNAAVAKPRKKRGVKSSDGRDIHRDTKRDSVVSDNGLQSTYQFKNKFSSMGALVPVNMRKPLANFFDTLEKEVVDIDTFLAYKLGYASVEDMRSAFMGLQVDNIAATIYNY